MVWLGNNLSMLTVTDFLNLFDYSGDKGKLGTTEKKNNAKHSEKVEQMNKSPLPDNNASKIQYVPLLVRFKAVILSNG